MNPRSALVAFLLPSCSVLASCGGAEHEHRSDIPPAELRPPLYVGELLDRRLPSMADDTFALFRAADMRIRGDTIFVADTGNDRIVLFDRALRPLGTIGSPGAGPGELRMPFQITVANGRVYVSERRNQRLSIFDRAGGYRRSLNYHFRSFKADIAVLPGGEIVAVAASHDHYLDRIDRDGRTRPVARRTTRAARAGSSRHAPLPVSTDKVVAIDDTVHVVDNDSGVLLKFDAAGTRVYARRIPDEIQRELDRVYERMAGSAPGRRDQVFRSYVASVTATRGGDLMLTFAGRPEVYGALVDAADYAFTPILVSDAVPDEDRLRSGRTAVLRGERLFVLDPYGILVYAVRGPHVRQ